MYKAKRYAKPLNFGGAHLPSCEVVRITGGHGVLRGKRVVIAWGRSEASLHGKCVIPGVVGEHDIIGIIHS